MPIIKDCIICGKQFSISPSREKRKNPILCCSMVCGRIRSRRKIEKTCEGCAKAVMLYPVEKFCSKTCYNKHNRDEKHYLWRGEKAKYGTKHQWIRRLLGSANKCIRCGLNTLPEGKKRYFDWANISGEYKREVSDWMQLCKKCHKAFDKSRHITS